MTAATPSSDWVRQRLPSLLLWKAPAAILIASALLDLEAASRGLIWGGAFALMGAGCVRNALRCRRLHCYFTGPFFLGLAAACLFHGFADTPLGPDGWRWIGAAALVGGIALTVVPERLWGTYADG